MPSAPSVTVGWYLGSTTTFAALYWLGGRLLTVGDREAGVRRLSYAFRPMLVFAAVVEFALLGARGVAVEVEQFVGLFTTGPLLDHLAGLAVVLGASAATATVASLGLYPHLRRARDLSLSPGKYLRRMTRYVGALTGVVYVVLAVVLYAPEDTGTVLFLGVLAFLLVGLFVTSPWLVRLSVSTRSPTEEERSRLAACCEAVGLDPAAVRVVEADEERQTYVLLRGLPGRRHLFVTDYLLEAADDDRLIALVGVEWGLTRRWHTELRVGLLTGLVVLLAGALLGWYTPDPPVGGAGGPVPVVPVALAVPVLAALWLGRRLVTRADDEAAAATDPETVADALAWLASERDTGTDQHPLVSLVRMRPSVASRIERLRGIEATRRPGDGRFDPED